MASEGDEISLNYMPRRRSSAKDEQAPRRKWSTPSETFRRMGVFDNHVSKVESSTLPYEEVETIQVPTLNAYNKQKRLRVPLCTRWCGCFRQSCLRITSHQKFPTWMYVARVITIIALGVIIWGVLFSMGGSTAGPGGQLFNLYVLYIAAVGAGYVFYWIKLPPLVGMILAGVVLRNVGFFGVSGKYLQLVSFIRQICLMTILVRAGIELDPSHLHRFNNILLRLSVLPSLIETIAVTFLSHYILDLAWKWAIFLGLLLASGGPAVTIPCLYKLQMKNYGIAKSIPTLVIASSSFDDIISLALFGIPLCIAFTNDTIAIQIFKGPAGIVMGIAFGISWGLLLKYVPERYDTFVNTIRTLILGTGSLTALLGSEMIGYESAGPIACVISAFVACHTWRKQDYTDDYNPVADSYAILWSIIQPVCFALIGAEVNIFDVGNYDVALRIAVLIVGIIVRMAMAFLVSFGCDFNWKEKIFVALSLLPKATAQAVIGPIALDLARKQNDEYEISRSSHMMMIIILAICITAPLGSILLSVLGTKLLTRPPAAPSLEYLDETEVPGGAFSELASGVVMRGFIQ